MYFSSKCRSFQWILKKILKRWYKYAYYCVKQILRELATEQKRNGIAWYDWLVLASSIALHRTFNAVVCIVESFYHNDSLILSTHSDHFILLFLKRVKMRFLIFPDFFWLWRDYVCEVYKTIPVPLSLCIRIKCGVK